jgi:glycerol-3-phosphate dehydrogenase
LSLEEEDVLATLSGIRAVVNSGKANPSKESREHVLWEENGLLTITGGKLTTFRVMAHDVLRALRGRLPERAQPQLARVLDEPPALPEAIGLTPAAASRLAGRYGADGPLLLQAAGDGELEPIAGTPSLWAELRWAARDEGVVHLEDLLLRRLRLGLLLPEGGRLWMDAIRAVAQPELGWDDQCWEAEAAAYAALWRAAYSLPSR